MIRTRLVWMNANPFKSKQFLSFYLTIADNIYLFFFNIVEDFAADNSYLPFNIVEDFTFLGSFWARKASLEKHLILIWVLLGHGKARQSNTERPFVVENQDKQGIVRQWGQARGTARCSVSLWGPKEIPQYV